LTNGACYDRLLFHDRYALQVLWALRNVIVIMLIRVMVQVCMAAEGAGVSGMGDGARKVIKKPLRLPLRLVSEFRKKGKMNVSRLVTVKSVRHDQVLSRSKHFIRKNAELYINSRCTCWRSWLRPCATSQKVAISVPDRVLGIVLLA
jgi:hypothetical protein